MEEATHFAIGLVAVEVAVRLYLCPQVLNVSWETFSPALIFLGSYLLCIVTILVDFKSTSFAQSKALRFAIKLLHACDGIVALLLGSGIFYKSNALLLVGMVCITKVFLLHLLSRMVTGVKAFSTQAVVLQTTKTFIHHTSSFYFISHPSVAFYSGLWRFISMNGHAALALKDSISPAFYSQLMWTISYMRDLAMIFIMWLCYLYPELRRGFALSASGHIAYMIVRLGPVFRIASVYFPSSVMQEKWSNMTDLQRIGELLQGKHVWLSIELGLLTVTSVIFLLLRITTKAEFDNESCTFI
jgi:hypothetical protein